MDNEKILKAIKNIVTINNTKENELDKYWKTLVKKEIEILPDGIIKRGATKELEALIQSFEREINLYNDLDIELVNDLINFIKEWIKSTDNDKKELLKPLENIANKNDLSNGLYATFNDMELILINIIYEIINTQVFLNKFNHRFTQKDIQKKATINNLNKSIDIAKKYNNYLLINELETMINQIDNENYITEEILYKSCFWSLHQILMKKFTKTTKALDLANAIMSDFFMIGVKYKATKNIGKKDFFENGFFEPRTFYYYKS